MHCHPFSVQSFVSLQACARCLFLSLAKTYHTAGNTSAAEDLKEDQPRPNRSFGALRAAPLKELKACGQTAQSQPKSSQHTLACRFYTFLNKQTSSDISSISSAHFWAHTLRCQHLFTAWRSSSVQMVQISPVGPTWHRMLTWRALAWLQAAF